MATRCIRHNHIRPEFEVRGSLSLINPEPERGRGLSVANFR